MECFVVYKNEIEGRIDPFYYRPEFREFEKKLSKIRIVSFGQIIKSITNGFDYRKFTDEGSTYLRVSNIKPFELDLTDVKKINPSFEINKNIKLKKDDLLLTRKGTFGVALSLNKDEDFIISSEIFKIELSKEVNPKFIEIVLNSSIGKKQFNKYKIGGIMGSLSQEAVKQIKIPLPPLSIQNPIVQIMDNAYKTKKQKEFEARQLLDSINDYVLSEIGIQMPELKDQMTFVVYADDVKGKRIDSYYYQPKFEEIEKVIEKGRFKLVKVKDVLDINNRLEDIRKYEQIQYIDLASIDKDLGIIKEYKLINSSEAPSRARQKVNKGDLLLASLNGSLKSIALVNKDNNIIASTGFYIIKKSNKYNNHYLWSLFRSLIYQAILKKETTGAIMSAINRESLLNLKIPFPPLEIQNKIAEEVKRRMEKAEQLQKEAKKILEKAKKEVEKIILEG